MRTGNRLESALKRGQIQINQHQSSSSKSKFRPLTIVDDFILWSLIGGSPRPVRPIKYASSNDSGVPTGDVSAFKLN